MHEASATARLDHIILGCADLDAGVDELGERLGITAAAGGRHAGLGTRNALAGLGNGVYLELLAPDPGQSATPLSSELSALSGITPFHWALRCDALADVGRHAVTLGLPAGDIVAGRRAAADGTVLEWQLLFLAGDGTDATTPFFIDWQGTTPPGETLEPLAGIAAFEIAGPAADTCNALLTALGVEAPRLRRASRSSLSVTLRTRQCSATFTSREPTAGISGW